ncbi:MAG: sulfite exporter TauE/SafE family protein [Polyangiaceae bacterium]|nr:sulfite exporter TauE/SafE family protein [Polyangiaceae bacterium]
MDPLFKLMPIVFLAFAVEASLGFGSALVAVTLGSMLFPIGELLPMLIPLSIVVSGYITIRYRATIDRPMLLRRIVPAMALGLPVGLFALQTLPATLLKRAFAAFILVLVGIELWKMIRAPREAPAPLSRLVSAALLFLGGLVHGAFSTGGPLVVYVAGRDLAHDKARFRSTLSALWLVMSIVLFATFTLLGRVDSTSLERSGLLVLPLVLGLISGEVMHARVPVRALRPLVFVVLGVAGVALAVQA